MRQEVFRLTDDLVHYSLCSHLVQCETVAHSWSPKLLAGRSVKLNGRTGDAYQVRILVVSDDKRKAIIGSSVMSEKKTTLQHAAENARHGKRSQDKTGKEKREGEGQPLSSRREQARRTQQRLDKTTTDLDNVSALSLTLT
jgi:hypothetical protein